MSQYFGDAGFESQIEVSQYVFAGSTAVFIWDVLNNVRGEYSLLFRHKSSAAVVAYLMLSFLPVGLTGSAFLIYHRVCAIYGDDHLVTMIFGCLCLAVLGSSITTPLSEGASGVGDPLVCINSRAEPYVAASAIILTVHKGFIYLAVSYRFGSNSARAEQQMHWKPAVSAPISRRSLVMDGQIYYMIVVFSKIFASLLLYLPGIPLLYHGLLVLPNVTLTSVMACRVYCNSVLGVRHPPEPTHPTLNRSVDGNAIPLSTVQFRHTEMSGSRQMENDETDSTGYGKNAPESSLSTMVKAADLSSSSRTHVFS
ncbi:hypothetical protein B0H19DRAFT_1055761 [Mycena capillaripes]|nr:hypothetical protein B0H19DRAFT_1055761 [Mycena capillaripes]